MSRTQILSDKHIGGIDAFVARVLDAYKAGQTSRLDAVLAIGHVTSAVDKGNEAEYTNFVANWSPTDRDPHAEVTDFVDAITEAGLRVSNVDAYRDALVGASNDWRAKTAELARTGRKNGITFFFSTPDTPTVAVLLQLVELLEHHGLNVTQRRAFLENVAVSAS
jgi:hypothetical protein